MPTYPALLQQLDDNERSLLALLCTHGPVTRQQMQELTGFSSSSMHRLTGRLEKNGLIMSVGEADSAGGRKPMRYGIGRDKGLLAGVELSRTEVRVMLCRPDLSPLESIQFPMTASHDPASTVDAIAITLQSALGRLGLSKNEIPGIGLGTSGVIDREQGMILFTLGFFHDSWQQVPIRAMLSERLGLPVHIDNGANMAVLAEAIAGCGQGRNIAYVHMGMGVRTGIASKGKVVRFKQAQEDVFGHMTVDLHGEPCHCGNRGCITTYASFPAFARMLYGEHAASAHPRNAAKIGAHIEQAEREAEAVRKRMEAAGHAAGAGLANLIRLADLEAVILGGPLIRYAKIFRESAIQTARASLGKRSGRSATFLLDGHFGPWTIAMGAALHVYGLHVGLERDAGKGAPPCRR